MRILYTIICTFFGVYLFGWLRYFLSPTPNDRPIEEYQDRLERWLRILGRLENAIETGYIYSLYPKKFPDDCEQSRELKLPELWPVLRKHIQYTIKKYNKIGRFGVSVRKMEPYGINMPFYPGLVLSHDMFWGTNYAFVLEIFLHEAYHDFYIGHGPDVDSIDGKPDIDIPLRKDLVPPSELFAVTGTGGAFGYLVDYMNSYRHEGRTAWQIIEKDAEVDTPVVG